MVSRAELARRLATYSSMAGGEDTTQFEFSDFRPDISAFPAPRKSPYLVDARNVIPRRDGYGPARSLAAASSALAESPLGGAAFTNKSGEVSTFAGGATSLSRLLTDGAWGDVTRAAGAYSVPGGERWAFAPFGDNVIATQIGNTPQFYNLTTDSQFSDVGGTPPQARFSAPFKSQHVLMNTANSTSELIACRVNNIDAWDGDGTNGSWRLIPKEGGAIGVGYEAYGSFWVGQQTLWRRITYIGDVAVVDSDVVSRGDGVDVPLSAVVYRGHCFYIGANGLMQFSPQAGEPTHIGVDKVDEWFLDEFNRSNRQYVSSVIDPRAKAWMLAFPSGEALSAAPDRVLVYYWPTKKFSYLAIELEQLVAAYSLGLAWDDLDDLYDAIDDVDQAFDSPVFAGGQLLLGALTSDAKFATFGGSYLGARFEGGDARFGPNQSATIRKLTPYSDVLDPTNISFEIGSREHLGGAISYSAAEACNSQGEANPDRFARFPRVRMNIAAGVDWSKVRGVDVIWQAGGEL